MLDHTLKSDVTARRLEATTETGRRRWFFKDDKARIVEETLVAGAAVSEIAWRHGLSHRRPDQNRQRASKPRHRPATALGLPRSSPQSRGLRTPLTMRAHCSMTFPSPPARDAERHSGLDLRRRRGVCSSAGECEEPNAYGDKAGVQLELLRATSHSVRYASIGAWEGRPPVQCVP